MIQDCLHVTHNYFIYFIEGLSPPVNKAHCRCTSLYKKVSKKKKVLDPFLILEHYVPSRRIWDC